MSWQRLNVADGDRFRNELDVVGYVCGCLTSQRLVYQACNLVLDSLTDRQPMQLTQHRRDVVTSSSSCDQTCSGVLNGLNLPQKAVWHAVQHGVAVVQATADKRLDCVRVRVVNGDEMGERKPCIRACSAMA